MSDVETLRRINALDYRMGVQEAKAAGPTLGELYGTFQGAPGLRGLWYPGSQNNTGAMSDLSGQGRTLTYNGNPTLNLHNDLVPYEEYDGTGDFHSRPDEAGISVLGNESYIAAARRGITLGGWFWTDDTPAGTEGYITQQDGSFAGSAYDLYTNAAGSLVFNIYQPASLVQAAAVGVITPARWNFIVGRFVSSVSVDAILNGVEIATTATAATATNNSSVAFCLGGYASGSFLMDGRCALAFLAASAWPDTLVNYLFNRTRPLFGV